MTAFLALDVTAYGCPTACPAGADAWLIRFPAPADLLPIAAARVTMHRDQLAHLVRAGRDGGRMDRDGRPHERLYTEEEVAELRHLLRQAGAHARELQRDLDARTRERDQVRDRLVALIGRWRLYSDPYHGPCAAELEEALLVDAATPTDKHP